MTKLVLCHIPCSINSTIFSTLESVKFKLANCLARINLDIASDLVKNAYYQFFEMEDVGAAISILSDEDLNANMLLKRNGSDIEKINHQALENFFVKARLAIINFDFVMAENNYKIALEFDSTNVDKILEFACFLEHRHHHDEADAYYQKALGFSTSFHQRATILNNYGVVLSKRGDKIGAINSFSESLVIFRELSIWHPEFYLKLVAGTLNNLAVIHADFDENEKALEFYVEALKIRRKLAVSHPGIFIPEVIATQKHMAKLYKELDNFEQAEFYYLSTIDNYKKLEKDQPGKYQCTIAMELHKLGLWFDNNRKIEKAKKYYLESIEYYNRISDNPSNHLPDIANINNNLGVLLDDGGNKYEAEKYYLAALDLFEQLAVEDPESYNIDICMASLNLAILYHSLLEKSLDLKFKTKGLEMVEKVVKILDKYPHDIPMISRMCKDVTFFKSYFESFSNLDIEVLKIINEVELNENSINQESTSREKIVQKEASILILESGLKEFQVNERLLSRLAKTYGCLAWYYILEKDFEQAEKAAEKGFKVDNDQIWIKTNLAAAILFQGNYKSAKSIYKSLKNVSYRGKKLKNVFLNDLKTLEKEGITHPDVKKIRSLLK